jgi:Na+/proline symporter
MAIMSTYSSELISVSSISAYDIYKTYINPKATGKQLMRVNYISMTAFALFMGGFSTMLYYIGVGMGYLYLLMGVIISSAVAPAAMTMIWAQQVGNFASCHSITILTHLSPGLPQHSRPSSDFAVPWLLGWELHMSPPARSPSNPLEQTHPCLLAMSSLSARH